MSQRTSDQSRDIQAGSLVPYMLITFGIAWGLLGLYLVLPAGATARLGEISASHPGFILAVWAPAIAAFAIVIRHGGWSALRGFLSRMLLWRAPAVWYAYLLLGMPLIFYAGAIIKRAPLTEPLEGQNVRSMLLAMAFMLVLGFVWGSWHLPAFWLSGTPQSGWGFMPFLVGSVCLSVIVTPMFNAAGGEHPARRALSLSGEQSAVAGRTALRHGDPGVRGGRGGLAEPRDDARPGRRSHGSGPDGGCGVSRLGMARGFRYRGIARWVAAAALLWLGASAGAAQPAPAQDAAMADLQSVLRAGLAARYAAARAAPYDLPGATLAVGLADGRVLELAVGYADVDAATPMAPDARMPSGSIGKTFVSALVLHLAERRVLGLDDRLADWLGDAPWFHRLPNGEAITVRQLLNHSSGLIDHVFDAESGFAAYFRGQARAGNLERGLDPEALVGFVLDRAPLFAPGHGFHYSDTNYILLGLVIERARGERYYDLLRERILEPLGLAATAPLLERLPQGYAPQSHELFGVPVAVKGPEGLAFDPSVEWTGGGLVTASSDLVRWALALFGGRVLGRESLEAMLRSIAMPEASETLGATALGYGLGISVTRMADALAYSHGGFFPGYSSMLAFFPRYGFAIAMQINSDTTDIESHMEALAARVIAELSGPGSRLPAQTD
ncbi:MAG: serine hydrolase domain-containing protein [Pseudomonadales bacterium]